VGGKLASPLDLDFLVEEKILKLKGKPQIYRLG
jgi:hypothetical protein